MNQVRTPRASTTRDGRIEVVPATPTIGAHVGGVALDAELSDATILDIERALSEHLVLFFHGQTVSPEQHRRFGQRFGTLQVHPFLPALEGYPEIVVLENDRARPPQVNFWHTDVTFVPCPPLGSILLAREVPVCGGDTIWTNMYAAYESLSGSVQRLLDGLTATHVGQVDRYEAAYGRAATVAAPPQAEHPIVRVHPVTGRKALFVNAASTRRVVGMSQRESDALLQLLFKYVEIPEFQVRLRWAANTVAFWDNRCTQHYAVADYWPNHRLMHRVTIEGDQPVGPGVSRLDATFAGNV